MSKKVPDNFAVKINVLIGIVGVFSSILILPPVFSSFLAVSLLLKSELFGLWLFSGIMLFLSLLIILFRSRVNPNHSFLFFSFNLILALELSVRLYMHFFASSETLLLSSRTANETYPDLAAFRGHPFLQFTGKPLASMKGNELYGNTNEFNNFGFAGSDFEYTKPPTTIRIAALGESTTMDGWPSLLEDKLNEKRISGSYRFEAMNFGLAEWNSAHSLVNFCLNVRDFTPDFIIIHHGWNETNIRNISSKEFKGDYTHALDCFHHPEIYDKYPIRMSVIYRFLKRKYNPNPDWTSLSTSTLITRTATEPLYQNLDELKPFRRNIETIIDLALISKIKVILTTLPHSTDVNIPLYYGHSSIDQCNAITREISKKYFGKIYFIDLDSLITGKMNNVFTDLGHITDEGRYLKSGIIAEIIWNNTDSIRSFFEKQNFKKLSEEEVVGSVKYYQNRIRKSKEWLKGVTEKAKQWNISLEEMILSDAKYMAEKDLEKKELVKGSVEYYQKGIRENEAWLKDITEKARKWRIPLEEMILSDAKYMVKQDSLKNKSK